MFSSNACQFCRQNRFNQGDNVTEFLMLADIDDDLSKMKVVLNIYLTTYPNETFN